MAWGDERVLKCIPVVSTWLADHMENVNIHGIKTNRSPVCTATQSQLGTLPKTPYAVRQHGDYQSLFEAGDVDEYEQRKSRVVTSDS